MPRSSGSARDDQEIARHSRVHAQGAKLHERARSFRPVSSRRPEKGGEGRSNARALFREGVLGQKNDAPMVFDDGDLAQVPVESGVERKRDQVGETQDQGGEQDEAESDEVFPRGQRSR